LWLTAESVNRRLLAAVNRPDTRNVSPTLPTEGKHNEQAPDRLGRRRICRDGVRPNPSAGSQARRADGCTRRRTRGCTNRNSAATPAKAEPMKPAAAAPAKAEATKVAEAPKAPAKKSTKKKVKKSSTLLYLRIKSLPNKGSSEALDSRGKWVVPNRHYPRASGVVF
jgi:hypothetical protein